MNNGVLLAIAGAVILAAGLWIATNRGPRSTVVPGTPITGTPISTTGAGGTAGIPQPPGEVPPGKVWSPEHGHWHDSNEAHPGAPQPEGDPPPGKVWSVEHGHWHDIVEEGAVIPGLPDSFAAPGGP